MTASLNVLYIIACNLSYTDDIVKGSVSDVGMLVCQV